MNLLLQFRLYAGIHNYAIMDLRGLTVLRIYLKSKIHENGEAIALSPEQNRQKEASRFRRNRRLVERFVPDQHQLSLMNGQDILHIHDLSISGFQTRLAEESISRFSVGYVYDVKLKARKYSIGLMVKVIWQDGSDLGFKIDKLTSGSEEEFLELIRVFEIAASLQEVNENQSMENKKTYFGLEGTSLQVWNDGVGCLNAWTLFLNQSFLRWGSLIGVETGDLLNPHADSLLLSFDQKVMWDLVRHREIDTELLALGLDIMYAWQHPISRELLASIESELAV